MLWVKKIKIIIKKTTLSGGLESLFVRFCFDAVLFGAGGSHQYYAVASASLQVSKREEIISREGGSKPWWGYVVLLFVFHVE